MIWLSRYPDAYRKMYIILEKWFSRRCIPVPSLGLRSKRLTSRPTQTGSGAIKTERSPALKVVGYQGAKTLERGACLNPQVGQYAAYIYRDSQMPVILQVLISDIFALG